MTLKIVSGAQTGADVAGLWIAKLFGIQTGGWAPNGWLTLDGYKPEMADTFGITEHKKSYRGRTIENLKSADLTIVCCSKMSAGSKLTIEQCKIFKKKCIVIPFDQTDLQAGLKSEPVELLIQELKKAAWMGIDFTLNVAGNSTNNSSRAFEFTFKMMHRVLTEIGYQSECTSVDYSKYQDRWA
jgi:hypothetical protein